MLCCCEDPSATPGNRVYERSTRGCTDVPACLLFLCCIGGMLGVGIVAIQNGDPDRLLRGSDYRGEVCGTGKPPPELEQGEWESMKYLWYPLTSNSTVEDALASGICVDRCPTMGDEVLYVKTYTKPVVQYPILYDSKKDFMRCFPVKPYHVLADALNNTISQLTGSTDISEHTSRAVGEIAQSVPVIFICMALALVFSFVYLTVMTWRCFGTTLTHMVNFFAVFLVFFFFLVSGAACLTYSEDIKTDDGDTDNEYANFWFGISIAFFVVAFLFVCLMAFLWRHVDLASTLIEEAAKVVQNLPWLIVVPLFTFMFIIGVTGWCLYSGINLASITDMRNITIDIPNDAVKTSVEEQWVGTAADWDNAKRDLLWFMFIGWLWTVGFLQAVGFMSIAFCAVFWYFEPSKGESVYRLSRDGSVSHVCRALWWTVRYHTGSLALGSLLITIVQVARLLFRIFEAPLRNAKNSQMCLCCVDCLLSLLDTFLHKFSKAVYVVICILGTDSPPSQGVVARPCCGCSPIFCGFAAATSYAGDIYLRHLVDITITSFISDVFVILGKLGITLTTCIFGWQLLRYDSVAENVSSGVGPMVVIGLTAYFVASAVLSVLASSLEAILVCYCFDVSYPGGGEFMSQDLRLLRGKEGGLPSLPQSGGTRVEPRRVSTTPGMDTMGMGGVHPMEEDHDDDDIIGGF